MAGKKVAVNRTGATHEVTLGSLWLAGVGAVSLARKQGAVVLGNLVGEGRRLQHETGKLLRESATDARAQATGFLTPLRARFEHGLESAGSTLQSSVGAILSRFGIPSKADIDELSRHIAALGRQIKAAK